MGALHVGKSPHFHHLLPISRSFSFSWAACLPNSHDCQRPLASQAHPLSTFVPLSLQPWVSFSLPLSLSLTKTITLSLLTWVTTAQYDHQCRTFILKHALELWVQRLPKKMGGALHGVRAVPLAVVTAPLAVVVVCGQVVACRYRVAVSNHRGWHLLVPWSSFHLQERNGTFRSRRKWSGC